jgi:(2R)-3-sulfolactate dehydrogenase (NADP+)
MSTERVSADALEGLVALALEKNNVARAVAVAVARALVAAEADGQKGHGLSRVASYSAQARSGKVDGHATPVARQPRTATLMIDVANGFAYPALDIAVDRLPGLAASAGIAAAGFVRSHHCGVVGRHVERLAEQGLVALMFANTPHAMAAWGGRRAVFGTNPIGFAMPRRSGPPLVIDMALSEVARGKILAASQKGEAIPLGWAVDAAGTPTTDAKAALGGTLMPAGGVKGAALALMVELLAAALTGANFASEASSFFDADGPPPGVGQLIVVIDADGFAGRGIALERFEALATMIAADGARLPGDRRLKSRAAARDGISVDAKQIADIRALASA